MHRHERTPRARPALPRLGSQRGVTLVELMVAMVLGLLLTAGMIQIFVGNRATYAFNEGLSRVQENGRFALDTFNYRARMAGYYGCLSEINVFNNLNLAGGLAYDFGTGLTGFEATGTGSGDTFAATAVDPAPGGTWTTALPTELSGDVIPGSDVLVIRNVSSSAHGLVAPYTDASQVFADAATTDYQVGEIAVVSDCQKASVFQISNVSNNTGGVGINVVHSNDSSLTPGNATPNWPSTQDYGAGSELLRAETWIYYVGVGANGGPALFQRSLRLDPATNTAALAPEELVEGVETMQVLYGTDVGLDGAVDGYVTADAVGDWGEVVSARIALLARAPQEYGTEVDDATYDVNGTTFDPVDDRRIREVFTTTVAIRNRLP